MRKDTDYPLMNAETGSSYLDIVRKKAVSSA